MEFGDDDVWCRFVNCNKCTTMAGDVDNRGDYICAGREYMESSGMSDCLRVRLFVCPTVRHPWAVVHQLVCPWDSPGKNTEVGCQALLQGIFPPQRLNPCLLCILSEGFFAMETPRKVLYLLPIFLLV